MNKDPAILFYTQDFITGTMFFSYEQKGKYITLLCAQHQQGGLINKNIFNAIVGEDNLLRDKFIECEDGFYNKRMMIEVERRSMKSANLSTNAKQMWIKRKEKESKSNTTASILHMQTEDENEDENESENVLEDVLLKWNNFAKNHNLTTIIKLTDKRKSAIKQRQLEKEFDLNKIFDLISKSDFLLGIKTDWKVDFDFIFCSKNNYLKILEGKYNGTSKRSINQGATPEQLAAIVARRKIRQDSQK